jgi:hypothetical protein
MPKGFCFQIERIARILTNARSRQSWLMKCSPGRPYPRRWGANCEKSHIFGNLIRTLAVTTPALSRRTKEWSARGDAV